MPSASPRETHQEGGRAGHFKYLFLNVRGVFLELQNWKVLHNIIIPLHEGSLQNPPIWELSTGHFSVSNRGRSRRMRLLLTSGLFPSTEPCNREYVLPPVLLRGCFFVKSQTLEPEWGQQPSSPEIISSSNEISQFHKDISGIVCIASLCSPRGKGWPHVFSLFFPTLKGFLVIYYHISPVSLVTLHVRILSPQPLLHSPWGQSLIPPLLGTHCRMQTRVMHTVCINKSLFIHWAVDGRVQFFCEAFVFRSLLS